MVQDGKLTKRIATSVRSILAAIVTSFAIVIALCAEGQGIGSLPMSAVGHFFLAGASALLIVLLVSTPDGSFRRMFRLPPLVAGGMVLMASI